MHDHSLRDDLQGDPMWNDHMHDYFRMMQRMQEERMRDRDWVQHFHDRQGEEMDDGWR